jgi:type IV secretory pathway TrbD component
MPSKNVGENDRKIRFIAGILAILMGLVTTNWIWGGVGLVLIATAVLRTCPAYSVMQMDTLDKK